ncbi:MAG TPA: hypothetical protein VF380_10610 [Solirubrobacteraceae bacterium]
MTRLRLLLISSLAALAVGAVASASASAAFKKEFFVEKAAVVTPVNVVGSSSTTSKLEAKLFGVKVKIECTSSTYTGTIAAAGASTGTISFSGCTVKAGAKDKCKVVEPINAELNDQLVEVSKKLEDEFSPATGGVFAKIVIEAETGGTCSVAGIFEVTGTQTCELPNSTIEALEHEIVCKPVKTLKLGGEEAKFTSTQTITTEAPHKEFSAQ